MNRPIVGYHKKVGVAMKHSIGYVAIVVRDYDEAIGFYVGKLGFSLVEDTFIEAQSKLARG